MTAEAEVVRVPHYEEDPHAGHAQQQSHRCERSLHRRASVHRKTGHLMSVQIEDVMSTNSTTLARLRSAFIATFMTLVAGAAAAQEATPVVGQTPLTVASNVPGNMVLVPSVEFPTLDSVANLGAYNVARTYTGYFDPFKCYKYVHNAVETERYFNPVRTNTTRTCTQSNREWSGNYLNWATTQTIDPFRKALTGGYRVKDTETETWLEKARSDSNGRGNYFPDRRVPGDPPAPGRSGPERGRGGARRGGGDPPPRGGGGGGPPGPPPPPRALGGIHMRPLYRSVLRSDWLPSR
jgi:hypothetical protein